MVMWLRQTAHDQEVMGLNPGTIYWMDVSNAGYYIHENNKNKGMTQILFFPLNSVEGSTLNALVIAHLSMIFFQLIFICHKD
jgi:hypothetical protein